VPNEHISGSGICPVISGIRSPKTQGREWNTDKWEKIFKKGISAFDIPAKFAKIKGFERFYGVSMKTFLMKAEDVQAQRKWWVVNADGLVLGRMATKVARILMGKNRPTYTPYVDGGDSVIIINAEKVRVTGAKAEQREYDYYTYYPGGHRYKSFADMFATRPEKVVEMAVKRMLPKNALARHMILRLKVVKGPEHEYKSQKPEEMKI
jgi:large subunit ribosomal protein L13